MEAYRAVGVPEAHIFVVNPAGELRGTGGALCEGSYAALGALAQHVFPALTPGLALDAPAAGPRNGRPLPVDVSYADAAFWRRPMPRLTAADEEAARAATAVLELSNRAARGAAAKPDAAKAAAKALGAPKVDAAKIPARTTF